MNTKKNSPLPFHYYAIPLAIILIVGFVDCLYLAFSHFKNYTDISYQSFCALSKAINCDTVSQSSYSLFLQLPVSVWGLLGYVFYGIIFFFALTSKQKDVYWGVLTLIGILFSLYSVYLAIISAFFIGSYCIMCIALYGTSLLLGYYPWLILNRFSKSGFFSSLIKDSRSLASNTYLRRLLICFTCLSLTLPLYFPKYWKTEFPVIDETISTGVTRDGLPWIGAKTPVLTITEYTDYMCFQCKKMHFFLRNLIGRYPEKLRLVHRHFPLDKKFNPLLGVDIHPGSGILSLIAIYAEKEQQFWKVNDYLYNYNTHNGIINFNEIAGIANIELESLKTGVTSIDVKRKLVNDILSGINFHINGTPSYVINGKVYSGTIPSNILKILN